MADTKLFQPLSLGNVKLQNRVALAPLTRFRCDESSVPLPNMIEYYTQRSCIPGTLLITEATQISPRHSFHPNAPGLWAENQVQGMKKLTDAVHAKGCSTFCQLIVPGRAGAINGFEPCAPSALPMEEGATVPHELSESEIWECISDFKTAAKNAIAAGFDGVELHGANGYLIDQFLQDKSNKRTDAWGGSVEKRSRFALEVFKACAEAIGSEKVGLRLSPWSEFQGMKMEIATAIMQYSHLVRELRSLRPAYLHLIESRVNNWIDVEKTEGLEFIFDIWKNQSPIIVAGGFNGERARHAVDEEYKDHDVIVAFGRFFISSPDLVFRLQHGIDPNSYDRSTFYTPVQSEGYTDYPFCKSFLVSQT